MTTTAISLDGEHVLAGTEDGDVNLLAVETESRLATVATTQTDELNAVTALDLVVSSSGKKTAFIGSGKRIEIKDLLQEANDFQSSSVWTDACVLTRCALSTTRNRTAPPHASAEPPCLLPVRGPRRR